MALFSDRIQPEELEIDRSMSKIAVFAALGIVFGFVFGYFLDSFLVKQEIQSLIISLAGLTGFLIVFLLQSLFIKLIWRTTLIIFLESAAVLAGFYQKISSPLIGIVATGMFLVLIWANYSGWKELQNLMKVRFWRISKVVLPKAIAGAALFVSVILIFPSLLGTLEGVYQLPFSPELLERAIGPVSGIIQKIVPGFDLSLPVGKLTTKLAEEQMKNISGAQLLSPPLRQQLIDKTAKEFEVTITEFLGANVNPKVKIADIIYETLNEKFSRLPEGAKNLVLAGAAILIFLTIEGFAIPFRWLVSILAFIIYEILLATGFAVIMMEGGSKEIILLK